MASFGWSSSAMEIRKTERITHERWLNLFVRTFRHRAHEGHWVFASRRPEPTIPAMGFDAVIVVPVVREHGQPPRLALVKEFRVPVGDYVYGFPAGLAEPGESMEAVARRELREETGLEVVDVLTISPPIYNTAGMTDEAVVMVFVTARMSDAGPAPEESEDLTVELLDHAQVCELCRSAARIDGKTWMALYMYQQLGQIG
jgi:ADP-ribose pyrophosphatase